MRRTGSRLGSISAISALPPDNEVEASQDAGVYCLTWTSEHE